LPSFSALDVSALAADVSPSSRVSESRSICRGDGVVARRLLSIDYVGRWLNFPCRDSWRAALPLDRRSPHVVAHVATDGTPLRLLVDTGYQAVAVYDDAAPVGLAGQGRSRNRRLGRDDRARSG
jgi:hypothetical protein